MKHLNGPIRTSSDRHSSSRKSRLARAVQAGVPRVSLVENLENRVMLSFTPIAQPNAAYTSSTHLIAISAADGTTTTSETDGVETVTSGTTLTRDGPHDVGTWNSPPNAETATPRVDFNAAATAVTLTLAHPQANLGWKSNPMPAA